MANSLQKMKRVKNVKEWIANAAKDDSGEVDVFPYTYNPTLAWSHLQVTQPVKKSSTIPADTPVRDDAVRFVCVSDTHNRTDRLRVPPGDVLLHAGDFSMTGQMREVEHFNAWLGSLPHRHKVVIAGNHDISFDDAMLSEYDKAFRFRVDADEVRKYLKQQNVEKPKDLLTNCIYLEDSGVQICGIKIFGSPWQPEFCGWAFNVERGQPCLDKWNLIPDNIDILVTHGPPIGHGDLCATNERAGCVELLHSIQKRIKPSYHVFGHIHEGYGVTSDGRTRFINASTCSLNYKTTNRPIVFDVRLPAGVTKSDGVVTLIAARDAASPPSVALTSETHLESEPSCGPGHVSADVPETVSGDSHDDA